jgi:hypothetical protein
MQLWFLVILLGNGQALQFPVESLVMCGYKSKQYHYELMIEDRYKMGEWYCQEAMSGKKIWAYEWAKNPKYHDPFYKGE